MVIKERTGKPGIPIPMRRTPARENSDTNWRRGMLLTQTDWDANGNPLKSISNDYKVKPSSFQRFYGSLVTDLGKHKAASATEPSDAFPRYFGQHPAVMETEFQYMATQEEITYDPTNRSKYVRQFREFTYDSPSHLFVTQQTMLNSMPGEKTLYQIPVSAGLSGRHAIYRRYEDRVRDGQADRNGDLQNDTRRVADTVGKCYGVPGGWLARRAMAAGSFSAAGVVRLPVLQPAGGGYRTRGNRQLGLFERQPL